jgi:hypothetical protein
MSDATRPFTWTFRVSRPQWGIVEVEVRQSSTHVPMQQTSPPYPSRNLHVGKRASTYQYRAQCVILFSVQCIFSISVPRLVVSTFFCRLLASLDLVTCSLCVASRSTAFRGVLAHQAHSQACKALSAPTFPRQLPGTAIHRCLRSDLCIFYRQLTPRRCRRDAALLFLTALYSAMTTHTCTTFAASEASNWSVCQGSQRQATKGSEGRTVPNSHSDAS